MALYFLVTTFFRVLYILIAVYALMSWFPPRRPQAWRRWVTTVVDPMLRPVRALVPPVGGVDLSPMITAFILFALQSLVTQRLLP